jgi:hypothetical protein
MVLNPPMWTRGHVWTILRKAPYPATVRHVQEAGEVAAEGPAETGAEGSRIGILRLPTPQWIERMVRAREDHPKDEVRHERTLEVVGSSA